MALRYIQLNSKRYLTANRSFKHNQKKARQVNVTLGGKVTTQTFDFSGQRWEMTLLVYYTPENPDYGSWSDLQTAYNLAYVPFVDSFNVNQGDVIMDGELEEMPEWALIDPTVPFEVSITLVKRQT